MARAQSRPAAVSRPAQIEPANARALLSAAVEEAARLLHADGAMVYLVEGDRLRFAVDAGIRNAEAKQLIRDMSLPIGVGLFGHVAATGELMVSGDYRRDRRFRHSRLADRIVRIAQMRSMVVAPLIAEGGVIGALGAYSSAADAFSEAEVALLRALADHAATAIANERLIQRLATSQAELARRVEAQRTLGEISARVAAIRDPDEVLHSIVDAARRLIVSDGAHLTLMLPGGKALRPTVMAGEGTSADPEWLASLTFPINQGINGLAAGQRRIIATEDYLLDPRIPHEPFDQRVAKRLGLRGMASAPLRGIDGEVLGTLSASFSTPHRFSPDELELLQGLADQGAIAIANSRLVEGLSESEARFRHLVLSSPDLVWETDASGRFTLLSAPLTALTGWMPDELLGKPWPAIVADESMDDAYATWEGLKSDPTVVRKTRFMLLRKDGEPIPAEVYAIGSHRDGEFLGAHGSIRDLSAAERQADRLRVQAEELERRVDAQRTLATMAAQLTTLRDPSRVLIATLRAAVRLLKGQGGQIGMIMADEDGVLRWADGHSLVRGRLVPFTKEDRSRVDEGVSGRAVREAKPSWTDDYLADRSFAHDPAADATARRLGIRAVIAAPLLTDSTAVGAIGVYAERPAAFDADDGELLGLLAAQATIVLTNAGLNAEAELAQRQLAHQVEAQRTLTSIAASITSLRDPTAVLGRTIEEAKRLLAADHVVIHQIMPGTSELADYRDVLSARPEATLADEVTVSIGQGIAGLAVAERRVAWTGDYLADRSFEHTQAADEWITRAGYRSQMSAPVIGEEGAALGAITAYSSAPNAFGTDDGEMLGALASQMAIVLGNARLYEQLERGIEARRSLGAIAARITAIRDPGDILQRTLDEAVRLLDADGGRIELISESGLLRWAFGHSAIDLPIERTPEDGPLRDAEGVSGQAIRERRVVRTGDYLVDPGFEHGDAPDRYIRQHAIRSVMSAPLVGEAGAIGSITVHSQARDAFSESDAELLEVLASQAAIAVNNARLYEQLRDRVDAQGALASITAEIAALRDPAAVLQRTADEAMRLLKADSAIINPLEEHDALLGWPIAYAPAGEEPDDIPVTVGEGISGLAMAERRVVFTGDYLTDPAFEHSDELDAYIRRRGMRSVMTAPLISSAGNLGGLTVQSARADAFDADDAELLRLLADQAAIAITNARLYEELNSRIDAQRSLADIAAQIAAVHDPQGVLDRSVADAARLLRADRAQINLIGEGGEHLDPPIAAAPAGPSPSDVIVPIGSGIAGMAAARRKVCWTGEYLSDAGFPHDAGDAWIEAQGISSMMSAPLLGPDRLIGTITIQAMRPDAFGPQDADLLRLLADQAAIALTNARLLEEVEESERRYRHLVDNSPDIVWSVDADGAFTFFSDSLESRTGWKPAQLLGKPFTVLAGGDSLSTANAAWEQVRADPNHEYRVRLELPLPDGRVSPTEVAMTGTVVDGRFAGAHGAVRDISERERLESDLRSQAAELAASQERAHLARELHDSVTQALFSMGLTLRTLEILLETDPDAARNKLVELRELQKDALAEMRTLIFELRPSSLESDGLVQALRTHATAVQRRTGLDIVVDAEPIDRLPLAVEEALYRIGQEALHNVVKHANASHATIRIWRDGPSVRLSVTDDGSGFDPDAVPRGHIGLIGMRQRADLIGGELTVSSRPGRGTVVEARVPAASEPVNEAPGSAE